MVNSSNGQFRLVSAKRSSAPELTATPTAEALRVSGLFAGIGGIELGISAAEHQTNLLCEIDSAAAAVLEERFPATLKTLDVRKLDALPRGTNMITAGFPCQDL